MGRLARRNAERREEQRQRISKAGDYYKQTRDWEGSLELLIDPKDRALVEDCESALRGAPKGQETSRRALGNAGAHLMALASLLAVPGMSEPPEFVETDKPSQKRRYR